MFFKNRSQAAYLLAEKLGVYKGHMPLVLGIPRGAVPMAKIIADALEGELDVVLVHKLSSPRNSELAIGAVDEVGHCYLVDNFEASGITQDYIEQEKQTQMELLRQRRSLYTPVRPPVTPTDRTVIVVDNGVATGFTMMAALQAIRDQSPTKLIAAMAVAPQSVIQKITDLADEVVCLQSILLFNAVGQFYEDFHQVSEQEVIEALRQSRSRSK